MRTSQELRSSVSQIGALGVLLCWRELRAKTFHPDMTLLACFGQERTQESGWGLLSSHTRLLQMLVVSGYKSTNEEKLRPGLYVIARTSIILPALPSS